MHVQNYWLNIAVVILAAIVFSPKKVTGASYKLKRELKLLIYNSTIHPDLSELMNMDTNTSLTFLEELFSNNIMCLWTDSIISCNREFILNSLTNSPVQCHIWKDLHRLIYIQTRPCITSLETQLHKQPSTDIYILLECALQSWHTHTHTHTHTHKCNVVVKCGLAQPRVPQWKFIWYTTTYTW